MKFSKYNLIMKNEYEDDTYLLLNTLTGATFKIDTIMKEKIESKNVNELTKDNLTIYKNKGIVIDETFCEERYFDYFYNKNKFNNKVLNLTILLTNACNLRCIYCFQGAGEIQNTSLNDETRENIYKFIKNQSIERDSKYVSIVLFGGEPLLNFKANIDWLNKIKRFCEENDKILITSMITNGTLITDEILDELKEFNCDYIQITLDGVKKIHDQRRVSKNGKGSFDDVIRGIKTIYNRKDFLKPTIRINIDRDNINYTNDLIEYLSKENLTECGIDFGIVKGGTEACAAYSGHCFLDDEVGDILEELWNKSVECGFSINIQPSPKTLFCGLYGDSSFTIDANGDLYKCWEHVGDRRHLMGRVDSNGNMSEVSFAFFDWMSRNPLETEECKECEYLPACGGGCGSISYERYGSYHSKGCFKIKGIIEKKVHFKFKDILNSTSNLAQEESN